MTIEEAIRNYEESERINTELAENCASAMAKNHNLDNAEKCRQMIEWLRELQERRKEPEIIYCHECIRRRKNTETGEYYCRASGLRNTDYDFCSGGKRAEGRTDE